MTLEQRLIAFAQEVAADVKVLLSRVIGGVHAPFPVASGGYVSSSANATALTTLAGAANRIDFVPFCPARGISVTELAVEVTTLLAASTARVGIYSDSNGAPANLLTGNPAALDCASVGVKAVAVTATLTAGTTYWLAVLTSGTQTLRGIPLAALVPVSASASGTAQSTLRRATLANSTALPTTAPATTATSSIAPWLRLKVA